MHARVSIFEGSPDQIDEMLRQAQEQVLPRARQMDGFKGLIALGDRQGSKTLGITFWESAEAMRASEEAANRMRSETAEASGEEIAGIYKAEVLEKGENTRLWSPAAPTGRRSSTIGT